MHNLSSPIQYIKLKDLSLISNEVHAQFVSLDWNSVCTVTQNAETGETMHYRPLCLCVCMPLHSFGLCRLEWSPAGGPELTGVKKKKDQRALVTQRVSSQLLKENHLLEGSLSFTLLRYSWLQVKSRETNVHCAHVSVCMPFLQPKITYQNVLLAAMQKRDGE